jgi:hypothetical protein
VLRQRRALGDVILKSAQNTQLPEHTNICHIAKGVAFATSPRAWRFFVCVHRQLGVLGAF